MQRPQSIARSLLPAAGHPLQASASYLSHSDDEPADADRCLLVAVNRLGSGACGPLRPRIAAHSLPGQDSERGPQRSLGDDREDSCVPPGLTDCGPVVVGRDQRAGFGRLKLIAVDVPDWRADRPGYGPRDLALPDERGDRDRHVVTAKRVVIERLAV